MQSLKGSGMMVPWRAMRHGTDLPGTDAHPDRHRYQRGSLVGPFIRPGRSAGPSPQRTMMTTALQRDRDEEMRRDMLDATNDLIGEQVLHWLGTPDDLLRVQVRPVGGGRYRANVFVGVDVISGRIAHSFFLA